ncbi:ribose 5-phosphate isomerase B [bacterium]|nr:ribose 5-phosphate isomerase B [bacterium]
MKIAIASDHGGYDLKEILKEYLISKNYEVKDFGCFSKESTHYPKYAKLVANAVLNDFDKGILICGTGIGMAIMANRFKGIRAANVSNIYCAKMAKEHNNANIITLGARVIDEKLAKEITDTWLEAEFQGERHKIRIDMLDK